MVALIFGSEPFARLTAPRMDMAPNMAAMEVHDGCAPQSQKPGLAEQEQRHFVAGVMPARASQPVQEGVCFQEVDYGTQRFGPRGATKV